MQDLKHEAIESLRLILEHQQLKRIEFQEAAEVGESLITFFEILADEMPYEVGAACHD